jgi:surfeit locus 1 family protein
MSRSQLILIGGFLLVAVVCLRLGLWQLDRLEERRSQNATAQAARSAPVVVLDGHSLDSNLANRRVRVRGRYDHRHDIVIRGRQYRGVPGVELVSPLLPEGGHLAVLVNRGFVPSPDAFTADPDSLREPGTNSVEGIALPIESGGGAPVHRGRLTTWSRLDRQALRDSLPYPFYPVYIRQLPDTGLPPLPRRLEAPTLDDGPHLSYAIQWFAFSAIALVFAGLMARQDRKVLGVVQPDRGRKDG